MGQSPAYRHHSPLEGRGGSRFEGGQTFLSAHVAEEALSAVSGTGRRQAEDASAQMCLLCFYLQDNRKEGRFFDYAQNDMLFDNSQSNVPNTRAPKLSS